MENHPIPQDVTGFQFRLIGDMTVKQFAYLAAGSVMGWIVYTAVPFPPILKLISGLLVAGMGAAVAFLPVGGRPMDIMISNFMKALFVPNVYLYQKEGGSLSILAFTVPTHKAATTQQIAVKDQKKLTQYLQSLPNKPKNPLDEKEMAFFDSLKNAFTGGSLPSVTSPTSQTSPIDLGETPTPENLEQQKDAIEKEVVAIEHELQVAKKEETTQKDPQEAEDVHQKVASLETTLQQTMQQKDLLEKELIRLQRQLAASKPTGPKEQSKNVRQVPKDQARTVGTPLISDSPNLISGIIKDPRGNVLPSILVEVKDSDGNPVRAFKTNGLGQFASATPIANGTYTLVFEDPREQHTFDTIEIQVTGQILMPLEVVSTDAREELRKTLFS